PLNIAEGNVKFSMKDRSRYLEIANGSALECAAALDVLVAQKQLTANEIHEGKLILQREVALVMDLRNNAQSRMSDDTSFYGVESVDEDD
ncbi:MAG: four helix bundle protein, partial [bacterium]